MPRVPVYNTPTVNLQAGRSASFSAPGVSPVDDATGAQLRGAGRALEGVGQQVSQVGQQMEDSFDDARIKEADALLSDAFRRTLQDPEKGYLNTVGKSALEQRKAAADAMEKARRDIAGTLTNDLQRQVFSTAADRRLLQAKGLADRHQAEQGRNYTIGETKARLDASVVDATAYAQDPKALATYKGVAMRETEALADLYGAGPEQRKAAMLDTTTRIHTGVVDKLVAKNDAAGAKSYLDANRDEILPDKAADLQRIVDGAGLKAKSLDMTLKITGLSAEKGGTLEQQAAYAFDILESTYKGKKVSAEEHDLIQSRLQHHYNKEIREQDASDRQLVTDVEAFLVGNPDLKIEDSPQLADRLRERGLMGSVRPFEAGGKPVTDPQVVGFLNNLPSNALKGMPVDRFVAAFYGVLSDQEMQVWVSRMAELQGTATPEQRRVSSMEDRLVRTGIQIGLLDPLGKSKSSDEQLAAFEAWKVSFDKGPLADWQAANKKKATDQDVDMLLDQEVLNQVQVDVDGTPTRMTLSQVPKGRAGFGYVVVDNERRYLRDIPLPHYESIIDELTAAGEPVIPETIVREWVRAGSPGAVQRTRPEDNPEVQRARKLFDDATKAPPRKDSTGAWLFRDGFR